MSKISSPDTTTTTATVQRIELPETQVYYTLRNTGAESIWWHSNLSITDATVNALATTAAARAAGLSELKVGETNSFCAHNAWLKVVEDIDGGAGSTLDIEPGILSPDTIIQAGDLNIGNVDVASTVLPIDADLDKVTQSKAHTHTTAGAAESIAGDTAFSAGATVMVVGIDTWVAVGDEAAQAQGGDVKFPAGVPFTVQLDGTEATFHLDAATGGSVSIHQVS